MKRIPPTWMYRLKWGRSAGIKAALTFLGVVGTGLTATSATGSLVSKWAVAGLLLGAGIVGVVFALVRGRGSAVPDTVVDQLSMDGSYRCEICTAERLSEACDLTRPYYQHEYVSGEIANRWRLKSPRSFVALVNATGDLCASFGIMALRDSFMDEFVAGRVSDVQLREDAILAGTQAKRASRLYISGVVVRDAGGIRGDKRAVVMIWAMLQYIRREYGLRRSRELFAIAVTAESERLLRGLGFGLHASAAGRVDRCPLYRYRLTKEGWEALFTRVGDYSRMCKMPEQA